MFIYDSTVLNLHQMMP